MVTYPLLYNSDINTNFLLLFLSFSLTLVKCLLVVVVSFCIS